MDRPTDAGLKQMLLAGDVEDTALPAGSKVGRYVVLEKLGFGGMSIVYKAYDPQLDRAIALKLMRVDAGGGTAAETGQRLLREAQALARISHPNIIAVHDVGMFGGDVFVAMEFVAGPTLGEWCRQAPRTTEEILEAYRGAGRGLAAAHAAGLVHRDFKPDNVIVGPDGRARVLDFGLARAAGASAAPEALPRERTPSIPPGDLRITQAGALLGTPAYMAPEQHLGGAVDARSDQFTFCVALHEAVYGKAPFPGKSVEEIVDAVLHGRVAPPPPEARVPGWLRPVLLRGLSTARSDRYPSMDELLAALDRDPRARRRAIGLAVAAVALVVVGVVLWRLTGTRDPCGGTESKLARVWDGAVKSSVRRAFAASGRPHESATFARVSRVLDGQAAEWTAMAQGSCEARRDGRQDGRATALRSACLEARRREMAALTADLAKADGRAVDGAVHAAFELTSVAACGDVAALALGAPVPVGAAPPTDPDACGMPEGGLYYPLEAGRVWVYDVIDKSTRRSRGNPKVVTFEGEAPIGGCKGRRVGVKMRQQSAEGWALRWQEILEVPSPGGRPPGRITVRHRDQWFAPDGTMTKDEYFVPSRIRLDETCGHTLVGASYLDAYDQVEVSPGEGCGEELERRTRTFDWRVVAVDVPVILELDYANRACCPPEDAACGPPPNGPGHTCTAEGDRRYRCEFRALQVDRREVSGGTAATYWFAVDVGKVLEDEKGEDREELMCFRR
jgi:predicted Ser/Thr protein kinase